MKLEHSALTDRGLIREMNQDALLAMPAHGLFAVADGMGGEKAGDEAAACVVQTIESVSQTIFDTCPPSDPAQLQEILRDMVLEANANVLAIARREPEKHGMGSTASLLTFYRGVAFVAQVGDSRVYRIRGSRMEQLTRDHTLVWALYERGALAREQLEHHPQRHLLTQCVGNDREPVVDLFQFQAQKGDLFLICSDGLTGYVEERKISHVLCEAKTTLDQKARRLVDLALAGGGGDNVTAVLVRVGALEPGDDWEAVRTPVPAPLAPEMDETVADEHIQTLASEDIPAHLLKCGRAPRLKCLVLAAVALALLVALSLLGLKALRGPSSSQQPPTIEAPVSGPDHGQTGS